MKMLFDITVIAGTVDEYIDDYASAVPYTNLTENEVLTVCRLSLSRGLTCIVSPADIPVQNGDD